MGRGNQPLPRAPDRHFPVIEGCVDKVGLPSGDGIAQVLQFYRRVPELLSSWDEYNNHQSPNHDGFDHLPNARRALQEGFDSLLNQLENELKGSLFGTE